MANPHHFRPLELLERRKGLNDTRISLF